MAIVSCASVLWAAACSGEAAEPPRCTNRVDATTVVMDDFSYRPSCPAVAEGATVSLDNQGAAPHTFTLEGTAIDVDIAAGERGIADLTGVAPGEYTVTCTYHPQMVATAQIDAG